MSQDAVRDTDLSVRVGSLTDFTSGEAKRVDVNGVPVCIVRLGERLLAIGDTCTHQDISLSEGEVDADDCTIECWKHGSAFSLETGEALSLPATRPALVFSVTVVGDDVVIGPPTEGQRP